MSKKRIFIFIFLILILQLTFFRKIKIYNTQPDILLITTIYFGLFQNFRLGFLVGLLCGFLEDIFSFHTFGVNTFLFSLVGLTMGFLSGKLYKQSPLVQILLTIINYLIIGLLFNALTKTSPEHSLFWFLMIWPGSFYTGLIAPLVIFILGRLFKPLSL